MGEEEERVREEVNGRKMEGARKERLGRKD